MVRYIMKGLFRSSALRAMAGVAAAGALAASSGSASAASLGTAPSSGSTTLFATAQGTSLLGHEIPVLGTGGWYVTVPVASHVVPGETLVWAAIDFTVADEVTVGGVEIVNLYVDPKMIR